MIEVIVSVMAVPITVIHQYQSILKLNFYKSNYLKVVDSENKIDKDVS